MWEGDLSSISYHSPIPWLSSRNLGRTPSACCSYVQDTEREAAKVKQKLLSNGLSGFWLSVWYETISNTEFSKTSRIDRFIIPMSSKEEKGFRPDLLLPG